MTLLLPLIAFLTGWCWQGAKKLNALLLARIFIPVVIVYNMVYYQAGSLNLMLFSFCSAILVYAVFCFLFKDKLKALCASYVNIGWLGFPFALLIFGQGISSAMIALYIGGSLFGNVWAIRAVTQTQFKDVLKKVVQSPPVIALGVALIIRLLGIQAKPNWVIDGYEVAKFAMVFAGMYVLGAWLKHTKITWQDIQQSAWLMLPKLLIGLVVCTIATYLMPTPYLGLMYFLFCLPPAANIVAFETHYQGTGVSARYIAAGTVVSLVVILLFWWLNFGGIVAMLAHGG